MRQLAERYPVPVICRVWETPPSSYYYQSQARDQHELRTTVQQLTGEWPKYGSRRLTAHLRREGFQVNQAYPALDAGTWGARSSVCEKHQTTNSAHHFPRYPNLVEQLEVVSPEQVGVCDITYIQLRVEFIYLAVLMDVADTRHPRVASGPQSRSELGLPSA